MGACRDLFGDERASYSDAIERHYATGAMFDRVNRTMGQRDLYPFTLSQPIKRKLAFVHDLVVGEGPRVEEEEGGRDGREPDSYWMPTARRALIARVCDPRVKRSMIVPTRNRPSIKTHNTPRPILPR